MRDICYGHVGQMPYTNEGGPMPKPKKDASSGSGPKLLSGENPQIPKGEGDGPVQAYIAAMPGWKRSLGERLDELIVRCVPTCTRR
jgi:hypothetical protein